MRRLAQPFLLLVFALVSGPALQAPEPSGGSHLCSREGQEALDAGEWARARQEFLQEAEKARQRGDTAEGADCSFYLGLVAQKAAKQAGDAGRRERLAEAVEWYEAALHASPRDLGLVNNLAQAYSELGQRQRAGQLFEESLSKLSGGAQAALKGIYAKFLVEDDWSRSAELYRQVLKTAPTDGRTWDELLSLLRRKAPAQLPGAVWEAVEAGQTESAQEAALTALKDSSLPKQTRIDLLTALVASLAEQHYAVDKFAGGEVADSLGRLKADPAIGRGVEEVLVAHQGSNLDAKTFGWWAEEKGPPQRSPLSVFRSLLRSLALRVDPKNPLTARAYLEAAEKLSPETFDPLLAGDLLTNYAATGDTAKILSSAQRWKPLLQESSSQLDPDAVNRYQLTLEAVRPWGGGGGGGWGGVGKLAYDVNANRCFTGPPNCTMSVRLEIPDFFQHPEGHDEGIRSALIEVGCTGRHLLSHRVAPSVLEREMQLASFASSGQRRGSSRSSTSQAALGSSFSVNHCRRLSLAVQPVWLSSAAWVEGTSLLLADSLRGQLLRYAADGTFLDAAPPHVPEGDLAYVRVQSSPTGEPVAENGVGLLWEKNASAPKREVKLVGRTGRDGTLKSVFQWSLLGNDEALAVANLLDAKGGWTSAIVRLPLAGGGYETLHPFDWEKPASILYRVGIPGLTSAGGAGYFLALEEDAIGLYRVPARGEPQRLTTFPGIEPELRAELARDQDMRHAPDLLRLLERTSLPAGLYGVGDDLFLLRRVPQEKHPGWTLSRLDPRTGRALHTVSLPTAAPHLTVAPGEGSWAFFEKSSVPAIGQQSTPSMLLVPTAWIQGSLTSAESGCDVGNLPGVNVSTHPSPPPPAGPSP
jgi:tetratricopeptide (TPR) repeat protein